MEVIFKKGSIFETDCETVVNTINTHGVMGAGLALEFKKEIPEMFEDYRKRFESGQLKIGEPYIWKPNEIKINEEIKQINSILNNIKNITYQINYFDEMIKKVEHFIKELEILTADGKS
ncbi:MAG: hypothetical protein NZ927_08980 [Candidatus Calescibacterium sp.]|nr:hypothetical protein [Candidatus Calescibacterium sp.]